MSKKRNKRNTKKFRKKLRMKNQNNKQVQVYHKFKMNDLNDFEKKIWKDELKDSLTDGEDVLYIPSYKKLPSDVVEKIQNYLKKFKVRSQNCFINSSLLTLNINDDRIKSCYGWYTDNLYKLRERVGYKIPNSESLKIMNEIIEFCENYVKNNPMKSKKDYLIKGNFYPLSDDLHYVNPKTGDIWLRHCWNTFNGNVHFDITFELHNEWMGWTKDDRSWSYYKMNEQVGKDQYLNHFNRKLKKNITLLSSYYTGSGQFGNESEPMKYDDLSTPHLKNNLISV